MSKEDTIAKVYYDFGGFGSIAKTLADATKIDPTITQKDVQRWRDQNLQRKTNVRGYNSFVASKAQEEYEMDLFEMPVRESVKKRREGEGVYRFESDSGDAVVYRYGLLLVDIFSKFMKVVPLESNSTPNMIEGLKLGFKQMQGKPNIINCDGEGATGSTEMSQFLEDEGIELIQTRKHANFAERHIRTVKDMMFKRMEHLKLDIKKWHTILDKILFQYNFNMVHSSHDLTPNEAKMKKNEAAVKAKLQVKKISTRKYPDVKKGDTVKIYQKKDKLDKERVSTWSTQTYKVDKIETSHGQKFYHLDPKPPSWNKPLMRSEILKV